MVSDKRSNTNLQRVGVLAALPRIIAGFGLSSAEVLAEVNLGPDALDKPEKTIPYRTMGLLTKIAAERTSCPHLGLEIGRHINTSTLGLLGEMMRNSQDVRSALRDFAAYQHRNSHSGIVYMLADANEATLGYATYQPDVPGYEVICDAATMAAFTLVCELAAAKPAEISRVLFAHGEPKDLAPYRQAFGVRLTFSARQNALVFPRRLLDRPIAGASSKRRTEIVRQIESGMRAAELDLETQVRRELRIALITGQFFAADIAERLGMTRWTLERRLTSSGTSYQKLLNETRCEFAKQLLANTDLDIAQIALYVGYNDPSVLTRAFTRWTGMPPTAWRTQAKQVA